MKMLVKPAILTALALAVVTQPASAQRRTEQDQAFEARRMGRLLPLPELLRRIEPHMGGARYIGNVFDAEAGIYTLRFLREGDVIDVDVDGRSGRVLGKRGR